MVLTDPEIGWYGCHEKLRSLRSTLINGLANKIEKKFGM